MFWLTQEELKAACNHIQEASKNQCFGGKPTSTGIPDGSLDECEKSHNGARDKGEATGGTKVTKGVMTIVCRHDIPLIMCDELRSILTSSDVTQYTFDEGELKFYPNSHLFHFILRYLNIQ